MDEPVGNGYYTASGINYGTIASNAAAEHYQQQVVFVMAGGGPL